MWELHRRQEETQIASLNEELKHLEATLSRHLGSTDRGPTALHSDLNEALQDAVDLWARSSLLLDELCRDRDIVYLQFLQPNQYDEGSKPLSDQERTTAFAPGHGYRWPAKRGYPLLRASGRRLIEDGVRFHDLSGLFRAEPRTLYRDTCCHYTPEGYQLLADAIASELSKTPPPSSSTDLPGGLEARRQTTEPTHWVVPNPSWRLVVESGLTGSSTSLRLDGGGSIPVTGGRLQGFVDRQRVLDDQVVVSGWAVDLEQSRAPVWVLAFAGGKLVGQVVPGLPRLEVAEYLQRPDRELCGYTISVPLDRIGGLDPASLRVLAWSEPSGASELAVHR